MKGFAKAQAHYEAQQPPDCRDWYEEPEDDAIYDDDYNDTKCPYCGLAYCMCDNDIDPGYDGILNDG